MHTHWRAEDEAAHLADEFPEIPLLHVWVPGKPVSTNAMYGARRDGFSKRLTVEAEAWRDTVAYQTLHWRFPTRAPRPTLGVSLEFVGVRANADIDNFCKLTLDGLKFGLAVDDRYIDHIILMRGTPKTKSQRGAWVDVWVLNQQQQAS